MTPAEAVVELEGSPSAESSPADQKIEIDAEKIIGAWNGVGRLDVIAAAAGIILVVSCFLPWVRMGTMSVNGVAGWDGKLLFALGVAAAAYGLMAVSGKAWPLERRPYAVGGSIALLVTVFNLLNTFGGSVNLFGMTIDPSAGIGLWLAVLASLVILGMGLPSRLLTRVLPESTR